MQGHHPKHPRVLLKVQPGHASDLNGDAGRGLQVRRLGRGLRWYDNDKGR